MAAPKKKRYGGQRLAYARATYAHLRLLGRRSLQLCKSALRVPVQIRAPAPWWLIKGLTRTAPSSPLQVGVGVPVMLRVVGPQLWVCRDAHSSQAAVPGLGPVPSLGSPWGGVVSPQALVTYYEQAWELWGRPNG